MRVWEKYGLLSPRLLDARTGDARYASLSRASRFRMALEELGGLHADFGRYLTGRADLLPSPHLLQLNRLRSPRRPAQRRELENEIRNRAHSIEFLRRAPRADVYRGVFRDGAVVIEFYPDGGGLSPERDWKAFCRSVKELDDGPEARLGADLILDRFRDWLDLAGDLERKRRIVANLADLPSGSLWVFPRLVPELQSARCLAYEVTSEEPLDSKLQDSAEGAKALGVWVEGLLEDSLLLSLVDAEMQPSCYTLLPGGRMGFRCLPVFAPVPVEWNYELLQYMTSTVAGNSVRALQMLSRMSSDADVYANEQHLMRELSALQPELKINVVTPASVTALENYWRALAATRLVPPAFLELFHRQWTQVGQYNGELAPASDLVAEAMWPVMGRILKYHVSETMTAEKIREWAATGGLFFLSSARQASLLLEQVRDNDVALVSDHQEHEPRGAKSNRRAISLVRSAVALAVFLVCVQLALGSRIGAVQVAAGITAGAAGLALAVFVARIE